MHPVSVIGETVAEARKNSDIEAYDDATVYLYDQAKGTFYNDSRGVLHDETHGRAVEGSELQAYDASTWIAEDGATVIADHVSTGKVICSNCEMRIILRGYARMSGDVSSDYLKLSIERKTVDRYVRYVSLDSGRTYLDALQCIAKIKDEGKFGFFLWDALVEEMDEVLKERVRCADKEKFLTKYLELAEKDLVIDR